MDRTEGTEGTEGGDGTLTNGHHLFDDQSMGWGTNAGDHSCHSSSSARGVKMSPILGWSRSTRDGRPLTLTRRMTGEEKWRAAATVRSVSGTLWSSILGENNGWTLLFGRRVTYFVEVVAWNILYTPNANKTRPPNFREELQRLPPPSPLLKRSVQTHLERPYLSTMRSSSVARVCSRYMRIRKHLLPSNTRALPHIFRIFCCSERQNFSLHQLLPKLGT